MRRVGHIGLLAAAIMLIGSGRHIPIRDEAEERGEEMDRHGMFDYDDPDDAPSPMSSKHSIPKTHPQRMTKRQLRRQKGRNK
jgi:hypothetical protein